MSWYNNYINNIYQKNSDYYKDFAQNFVNESFDDTTLIRTVKEEKYPFTEEYEDYEVKVDTVAEITINIDKVIGDFISLIFKDCNHRNLRGQKYIFDDETYLCYDKINKLSTIAETKLIRCNNSISWLSENNEILTEKVFLGYELTSTNDSVGKDGIVSNRRQLLYLQYNDKTKNIKINQRFMFQHNQCFRVEEIDNYNQEDGVGEPTMIKIFLVYSANLPTDNKELNICDYYSDIYNISIEQDNIIGTVGYNGKLTCVVTDSNKNVIDRYVIWDSETNDVIIEQDGTFNIVDNKHEECIITCSLKDNPLVFDKITIIITEEQQDSYEIFVYPKNNIDINENSQVEFECYVMLNGEKLLDEEIECVPSWIGDNYSLIKTEKGYLLKNNLMTSKPLYLLFKNDKCEDEMVKVSLIGLF